MSSTALQKYIEELSKHVPLERKIQNKLVKEYQKGKELNKDILVNTNQRLVTYLAKRYRDLGAPLEDLIQEGNIGLMKAMDKYKFKYKTDFPIYASNWIVAEILRYLNNQNKIQTIGEERIQYVETDEMGPEKYLKANLLRIDIDNMMEGVDSKTREMIVLRFGLNGLPEHNLREISEKFKISIVAVHYRIKKTLKKIKEVRS